MYIRLARSGGRTSLQIVEGFRAEGKVRQRVVANLGRMDQLEPKHLEPLINGLNRAIGRTESTAVPVEYDSALAFGDVYALHEGWGALGFRAGVRAALRIRSSVAWSGWRLLRFRACRRRSTTISCCARWMR